MKKLYIIILNYNGWHDTKDCLASLHILKAKNIEKYIVVVDNGSTDGSVENLKSQISKLNIHKIIENGGNIGFAKGNNRGIQYALDQGADYILLLNNDTKIIMNFLPSLLRIDADIGSPVVKFKVSPGITFNLSASIIPKTIPG